MLIAGHNIIWHPQTISNEQREKLNGHRSCILWFTGLSGAGKSTIANGLEATLFTQGVRSVVLDGDNIRHGLNKDLGFSAEDRAENIRRISEVAKILKEAGLVVLVATISPYRKDRALSKQICGDNFYEVYVSCDIKECIKRDPKGLYQKAIRGEIQNFTGISSPYESPEQPDIVLESDKKSSAQLVEELVSFLKWNRII
jgi:adenylylsulfate kinase (apsK)